MFPFKKKRPKHKKVEDYGKMLDNRASIIFKNTCELCYTVSFNKASNKETMYNTIASNDQYLKHSNLVIVINVYRNNIDSIVRFLSNTCNLKVETYTDGNEYIIVIGGSILDYKKVIRTMNDLNNSIITMIFDCLYQLDYRFFKDFIDDGIMNRDMFRFESEIEYMNIIDDFIDIVHIDAIMDLYVAVSGKIPLRRLMKFVNVTTLYKGLYLKDAIQSPNGIYIINQGCDIDEQTIVNWGGSNWNLNQLGNLILSAKDVVSEQYKDLYNILGSPINMYETISLEDFINHTIDRTSSSNYKDIEKHINTYMINNFGEDTDITILQQPEYIQKVSCNDDIEYIDEVINEEVMSIEEYFNLYMEQEDNIEDDEDTTINDNDTKDIDDEDVKD